jgi:hypothetical protein
LAREANLRTLRQAVFTVSKPLGAAASALDFDSPDASRDDPWSGHRCADDGVRLFEATALSLGAFFVRGDANKLESNSIAVYTDRLAREDGRWKFKRRELGAVPAAAAAGARPR